MREPEEDQAHCKLTFDRDGLWRTPRGLVTTGIQDLEPVRRLVFCSRSSASFVRGGGVSSQETLGESETPDLGTQAGDGQWGVPLLAGSSSPGS